MPEPFPSEFRCDVVAVPRRRDLAADAIPITATCGVPGFSAQAFYKWRQDLMTHMDWEDAHLINAAYDIHDDDPAFGYHFIAGENRVARLCSQQHTWSAFVRKRD